MLDTKLKSNSNLKSVVMVWLLLTVMAVITMSLYPVVYARLQKQNELQLEASEKQMDDFLTMMYAGSIGLYWDYVNSYQEEPLSPSQLYFPRAKDSGRKETDAGQADTAADAGSGMGGDDAPYGSEDSAAAGEFTETVYYGEEEYMESNETDMWDSRYSTQFNDKVKEIFQTFLRVWVPQYELEYEIYSAGEAGRGNAVSDLKLLEEPENNEVKEKYAFYAAFCFDKVGNISVTSFKGIEERYLNRYISEFQDRNRLFSLAEMDGVMGPSDMISRGPESTVIIFASARDKFYMTKESEDYFTYSTEYRFGNAGFTGFLTLALALVALVGIGLPFMVKENDGSRFAIRRRVPMEFVGAGILTLFCLYGPLSSMGYYTATNSLFATFLGKGPSAAHTFADYLFNYSVWILYYGSALFLALAVHPLFTLGPVRYLNEYSYCGHFLVKWGRLVKHACFQLLRQLKTVDLKDTVDRQLLILLGINFIVLTVLCCAWVAGVAGLFVYTIVLFLMIRKRYERVREDYCDLLLGVQEMADGNLEIRLPEDLGVFNSVKEELLDIQTGFKKAVQEEIKSQRMRSELITNVSHDLKTPLTSIITYTNLLKEEGITEEQRQEYIETLDQKSQRLKRLIEDLFVISKASSNSIVLNPVNLDLAALIKQVMFELDDRVKTSEIEFRCSFHPDKLLAYLDCDKSYRIFENLVVNILKYGMPHSRAFITGEKIQNEIWITLKNTSEQELTFQSEEITERFVRGDQSRNTEGSGLGLAIAKSFTTIQGGTFDVVLDGDLFKVILKWKANE